MSADVDAVPDPQPLEVVFDALEVVDGERRRVQRDGEQTKRRRLLP